MSFEVTLSGEHDDRGTIEVVRVVDGHRTVQRRKITWAPEPQRQEHIATCVRRIKAIMDRYASIDQGPRTCAECGRSYPDQHPSDCSVRRVAGTPVGFENAIVEWRINPDAPTIGPRARLVQIDGTPLPPAPEVALSSSR